ncbi:putative inactive leucine-rich repeat receptor protein kinase [Trifolium repens]|nr:putative inactive leucine-rich repeat receptor protein kinase [Trifolium repens]
MKNFLVSLFFLFPTIFTIILVLLTPIPSAQLTPSETRILLQLQTLLEFPQVLHKWNNLTNFCNIPSSPSFNIICSKNHITELTIIGNKTRPVSWSSSNLSQRFSIESFFTILTKLSNMKVLSLVSLGLWGTLPSKINRFKSLEVFNISSNFFYGKIPSSVSSMTSLKSLVLADNFFNGSVPNLNRLVSLEEVNFVNNRLGPEFPSFLFSLPLLNHLNLASNQFNGSISLNISCDSALTFVDISNNFLQGNFSSCIDSNSLNRTIVYSGNCLLSRNLSDQHPSSYCNKSPAFSTKPTRFERRNESKMQLGSILGIVGGFVGIVGLMIILFLFISKKSETKKALKSVDDRVSVTAYSRPNIFTRSNVSKLMRLTSIGLRPYNIFTIEEIEDATNNFDPSNLIGEGSQGQLYKGRVKDGSMVMVNIVKLKQKSLSKISDEKLKVLPCLRHRHLVSVLGHCAITYKDNPNMTSTIFIVFEHISTMSSLRIHLTDRRKMLKWKQRMTIMIGIARGIQYLHRGVNNGIFGNNLKIENILLDNNLNPKVSGYSIPFPSKKGSEKILIEQKSHNHIGSINNAEKDDIYQFGVILLEVITGKLITSSIEVEVLKYELERGLSEVASPTALRSAIDPSLHGTYTHESLKTAIQITINCLNKVPGNRPSIEDILWNLQYSMQVQEARSSITSS